jgi:hypothetical protein
MRGFAIANIRVLRENRRPRQIVFLQFISRAIGFNAKKPKGQSIGVHKHASLHLDHIFQLQMKY